MQITTATLGLAEIRAF